MIPFRLSVLGWTLLELELGESSKPSVVVVPVSASTTQSDGCFFAHTAQDVAYDEALTGPCGGEECEGCEPEDD